MKGRQECLILDMPANRKRLNQEAVLHVASSLFGANVEYKQVCITYQQPPSINPNECLVTCQLCVLLEATQMSFAITGV